MNQRLRDGIDKLQITMQQYNLRVDQIVPAIRHLMVLDPEVPTDQIRKMPKDKVIEWWLLHTEEPDEIDMVFMEDSYQQMFADEKLTPAVETLSESVANPPQEVIAPTPAIEEPPSPIKLEKQPEESETRQKVEEKTEPMRVEAVYDSPQEYEKFIQERENQQEKLSIGIHRLQNTMEQYGVGVVKVVPQIRHLMEMDPAVPINQIQYLSEAEVIAWWQSKQKVIATKRSGLYDYTEEYYNFLEKKKRLVAENNKLEVPAQESESQIEKTTTNTADEKTANGEKKRRSDTRKQKKRFLRQRQGPLIAEPLQKNIPALPPPDEKKGLPGKSIYELVAAELIDAREMYDDDIFNEIEYQDEKSHVLMSLREYSDPIKWKDELRILNQWKKDGLISSDEFQVEKQAILKARKR